MSEKDQCGDISRILQLVLMLSAKTILQLGREYGLTIVNNKVHVVFLADLSLSAICPS
jgi:hypothetical protein